MTELFTFRYFRPRSRLLRISDAKERLEKIILRDDRKYRNAKLVLEKAVTEPKSEVRREEISTSADQPHSCVSRMRIREPPVEVQLSASRGEYMDGTCLEKQRMSVGI
jgi:hypothetical protein